MDRRGSIRGPRDYYHAIIYVTRRTDSWKVQQIRVWSANHTAKEGEVTLNDEAATRISTSGEEMAEPISTPARDATSTGTVLRLALPGPSSSPASNTGIVRVSWNNEERSPAKDDLKNHLLKHLLLRRTRVEMRLSRRSAFVICDSEQGTRN